MKLTQSWVGYLDRSYEQIKRSLILQLTKRAPEISDHSESNPLIILLSMFAGVGEMINLYMDSIARESFLGTCRRYSSAVKLSRLIDYQIKARNPSTVELNFYLLDSNGQPINNATAPLVIPKDTIVYPANSTIPFRTISQVILPVGLQNVYSTAIQYTNTTGVELGTTTGDKLQKIQLPSTYVNNSLKIFIDSVEWIEQKSFGYMGPTDLGFVVNIDEDSNAFVQFGDGINGAIPLASRTVFANYKECSGTAANLPPSTITEIQTPFTLPTGITLNCYNPDYSSGGTDFESLDDIKDHAPRSLRTLERAVTYQDYLDLPLLVPGVGASALQYCCGKYVDVYIAPNSKGVATRALTAAVTDYMQCRIMITSRVTVQPSGISRIWLEAKIYGKPLEQEADIYSQVVDALDAEYGFDKIAINPTISITDIITTVEKLTKVETIEIAKVRIEPYARPQDNTTAILNIQFTQLPITTAAHPYKIIYIQGTDNFRVFKNGLFLTTLEYNTVYNDLGLVAFKVLPGVYADNNSWEFTILPSYPEIFPTTKVAVSDYSAAIIDVGPVTGTQRTIFSNLTIITQGSSSTCLPPCS